MKRIMCLMVVLVILGLVVVPTATQALPKIINIGTHAVGNYFNVIGSAEGAIVSKFSPMKAIIKPIGIPAWMPGMVTGEIDIGVVTSIDANGGYLGSGVFHEMSQGKGFPMRLVLTGIYGNVSMVAPGNCNARQSSDLKGLSIAAGFASVPTAQIMATAVLANAGLTWQDVKLVPVASPGASINAVKDGRADVAGIAATGTPALQELAATKGAYFINLNCTSEAKSKTLKSCPYTWLHMVKDGAAPAVHGDTWMLRYEIYTVARKDLPDEVVRTFLETMWGHHDELVTYHAQMHEWKREGYASKKLAIPYHPAAVQFLKEKGLWTEELEKSQKELLALK